MSAFFDRIDHRVSAALTTDRRVWLQRPRTLLLGFLALQLIFLLALLPAIITGHVLGDLPLYRTWAEQGLSGHVLQGIDVEWVYPIGALGPILLAGLGGPFLYQFLWFLMTVALNAVAIAALTNFGRRISGYKAAWWWMLMTFVLSPVALLRLEGVTAPLVIVGLVLIARRPIVATVLLAVATWIKVWPAAVLLAVVAASRRRLTVAVAGALVTGGIVTSVWALGGLNFIAGFVTMQSDRALQLEAPVTTPWVWMAALGQRSTYIYQNFAIETREVNGPGADFAAALMTPLMFIAIAAIFVLMLLALRRTRDASHLLLVGALALVSSFVVFNKVGSPQYMLWIAPIVAVGIARSWRKWRTPAYLVLAIGVLTTLIFPIFYLPLIDGDPVTLLILTIRNALLVVLLGWSVVKLWSMVRSDAPRRVSAAGGHRDGELRIAANLAGLADDASERRSVAEVRVPDGPQFAAGPQHASRILEELERDAGVDGRADVERRVQHNELGRGIRLAAERVIPNDRHPVGDTVGVHGRARGCHGGGRLVGGEHAQLQSP